MARGRHTRPWVARLVMGVAIAVSLAAGGIAVWAARGRPDVVAAESSPSPSPSPSQSPSPIPSPSPSPEPKAKPREFTIAATGDILLHEQVWQRAASYASGGERFDFHPMFAKIRDILSSADLAICHLETPLSRRDRNLSSYPLFNVPHEVADAIEWAGYDECSTASNHALDQGSAGIDATLDWLDREHVSHAGTARSKSESNKITMLKVNHVQVAHLSYAYGFNGHRPNPNWEANQISPKRIIADAKRARDQGAEFTVVSLHWGTEYVTRPNRFQRKIASRVADSPAVDLMIGHHAHTVQPIDVVSKKYVVFGMGNFLSGMEQSAERPGVEDGVIIHILVKEDPGKGFHVEKVTYTPTWVESGSWRIVKAGGSSRQRTIHAINLLGADKAGIHPE